VTYPSIGEVRSAPLVFRYGLNSVLVLADGREYSQLASAHDPVPQGRNLGWHPDAVPSDPFSEPRRPLRLTLGSDLQSVSPTVLHGLFSLTRYPNITLDAMPVLDTSGWPEVGRISVERSRGGGPKVGTSRPDARLHPLLPRDGLADVIKSLLKVDDETSLAIVQDVSAHEALANDYLVSPRIASNRGLSLHGWDRRVGACTIEEALLLAGLKARMYGSLPLYADNFMTYNESTGAVYDMTVMRFSRALSRAFLGALAPDADPLEARTIDHLLAIRGTARDLLIARDELYRLARREALGGRWLRETSRRAPVAGPGGNELVYWMSYHVEAALNNVWTILDNLAAVVSIREGLSVRTRDVSFQNLLHGGAEWSKGSGVIKIREMIASSPSANLAVALKELRNVANHRTGLSFGTVEKGRSPNPTNPTMLAMWLPLSGVEVILPDEQRAECAAVLSDFAEFKAAGFAILRPTRLATAALHSAWSLAELILGKYQWSPGRWHRESGDWTSYRRATAGWHGWFQRGLMGL